jgi:mRNA degradation ribonuclease J1/J2
MLLKRAFPALVMFYPAQFFASGDNPKCVLGILDETTRAGEEIFVGDFGVDKEIVDERNTLANDGVIQIVAYVDTKLQKVVREANIVTKGFVYTAFGEEGTELIKQNVDKVLNSSFTKRKNLKEFEAAIENDIKRLVYRLTKKSPVILPVVIDLKNIKY